MVFTSNPHIILMMISLFMIFIGMFLEGWAAIIILAPTLIKVSNAVGIDPLHFGFVMVLKLGIGLLTPPLGVCLFVVCGVTRIDLSVIVRSVIPLLLVELCDIVVSANFPWIILFIPNLLGHV